MGKMKPRLNSRKKAKRWKKGQSSLCNPETTKYRDAAKSNYFSQNLSSKLSNLTIDKLKRHDALQGTPLRQIDDNKEDEDMDGASTCKTMNTYASNYSKCSNMSFSRFLTHFQEKSTMHQDMLATLKTVADMIKQNGGSDSTVEYFASFISALQQSEEDENESEGTVAAIITLLGMAMKNVDKSVLKQKFGLVNELLFKKLVKYTEKKNDYVQRHCIGCLSVLLKAQEKAVWSEESTKNTLVTILNFTTHGKPKLRKAAHHAIISLLKSNDDTKHPATPLVAKYLMEQLETSKRLNSRTSELYTLTMLKEIWHLFPKQSIKVICEKMMGNLKLNDDIIVATSSFETLYNLFVSRPSPENVLPPELNAQIVNALYDFQPSNESTKLLLPWLTTVLEALCNLSSTSLDLCAANITKFLDTCMKIWSESNKQEVLDGVATKIKDVILLCVASLCVEEHFKKYKSVLHSVIEILSQGLNFTYNAVWKQVFNLLALLFQTIGPVNDADIRQSLKNTLANLVDLRESKNISFPGDADYTVGAAVKAFGPEVVLEVAPLISDGNLNLHRYEWLFPVLNTCISHAKIAYFRDHFLSLAISYYQKHEEMKQSNMEKKAEAYRDLSVHIWALFPSFCHNATDISATLQPQFAKCLGGALDLDKKFLHPMLVSGLHKLILKSMDDESDKNTMSRYAKNILPRLNNIYLTQPSGTHEQGTRNAVYEAIKAYLKLAHLSAKQEICALCSKAISRLETPDSDFEKQSLYDLIMVYCQYVDLEQLEQFYETIKPLLKDESNQKEQKKAFRFLEEICNSETEVCLEFLKANRFDLKTVLIQSTKHTLSPSKSARIRILTALLEKGFNLEGKFADKTKKFLIEVISEATVAVKEQNAKCRTSAFDLFNVLAEKFKNNPENFSTLLDMVMAGLGHTHPGYCSGSILILASLLYNYHEHINKEVVENVLECMLEQLQKPTREIVKSAFAFVQIYLKVLSNSINSDRLKSIVQSLCGMTEDCKRHLRIKVRDILVKLIRKFGHEVVVQFVPQDDKIMHKRLKNIRKAEARKQNNKKERANQDDNDDELELNRGPRSIEEILADSDDDSEDDTKSKKSAREARKRKGAWIQEESEKILDFTDPSVSKKISTTKPSQQLSSEEIMAKKDRGFKTAPDGRMIIADIGDDDDDEPTQKKKKTKLAFLGEDNDDYEDDEDDLKTVKSTKSAVSMKSSKSFATHKTASTYKAGGSGIHRPLNTGEEYRSKKGEGDVKKKGKLEPYAYVPLRRSSLNKRKKMKNGNEFKSIMNKSKKGKVQKKPRNSEQLKHVIKKAMKEHRK